MEQNGVNAKKKSTRNRISMYFGEFFNNTTIHGFKYLVGTERSFLEKSWWLLVLSGSVFMCQKLVRSNWEKWEENPVLFSFKQTPVHLSEIPFPAVTVCPHQPIKQTKYNFTYFKEKYWSGENLTDNEFKHYMDIAYFCARFHDVEVNHTIDLEALRHFIEVAPKMEDSLNRCVWHPKADLVSDICEDLFSPIVTSFGICFSFNMLDQRDLFTNSVYIPENFMEQPRTSQWDIESSYDAERNEAVFPLRVSSVANFLQITVESGNDTDGYSESFEFMIHQPAELPLATVRSTEVGFSEYHDIRIKPKIIVSNNLESYTSDRRKCFYSNERQLKFYKIYTETNCKIECLSMLTLERCGCVLHYLPHEKDTTRCGMSNWSCALRMLSTYETDDFSACNCLPACFSVKYDIETLIRRKKNVGGTVIIHFKETTFLALERKELFGSLDFWAYCGGVLGLCTGFSILSLAEIFYYLTLRWMINMSRGLWEHGKRLSQVSF